MSQIKHIINRELKIKIKSKGFYFFVLISPVFFLLPILIGIFGKVDKVNKNYIAIKSRENIIKDTVDYKGLRFFSYSKNYVIGDKHNLGVLKLSDDFLSDFNTNEKIKFYLNKEDLSLSGNKIRNIQNFINQKSLRTHFKKLKISDSVSNKLSNLKIVYPIINQNNKEIVKKTAQTLAFVLTLLMYVSFILFNNSIIISVVEEKTNKLAEVLSIFVSPKNLMAGKILGQSISFLIQLVLWIVVFLIYVKMLSWIEMEHMTNSESISVSDSYLQAILNSLTKLPLIDICLYLPLFFILGLLLNGTFNTILGVYSKKNNSNHLMMIGNIINLISIYFGVFAAINPNSTMTKISYFIPFLNYLTIPTTLPFDLPINQILISLFILTVSTAILFYWCAKAYEKSIRN